MLLLIASGHAQTERHAHPPQSPQGQQDSHGSHAPQSPNAPAGDSHAAQSHAASTFIESIMHHSGPGTSADPISTPRHMLMTHAKNWDLMLHGVTFLNAIQQSGPRGADKVFSANWIMPMAQRRFENSTLTFRGMFSLEPATVTNRRYPLLFQSGETAFGEPIADGQHPHDFFIELAALYDHRLTRDALLSFYFAPVGDPALGPTAFVHRASASENPLATLGHHMQDSTHIATNVITGGITYKNLRLEASGFHGAEPDEDRWNLEQGKLDSWSGRLTAAVGRNWVGQFSFGYLTGPESLHPDEDLRRMTASITHNKPLPRGNWASTAIWGRNCTLGHEPQVYNTYVLESTLRFDRDNYLWARIENADRSTDLLHDSQPPDADERFLARVQAYTLGYARDINLLPRVESALGAQVTVYGKPDSLTPIYGSRPAGLTVFLRIRPAPRH